MGYYPIFLELGGKNVLVVGGGRVARRKVETLLGYGAVVRIVSRQLNDGLKRLVENGKVFLAGEEFNEEHLNDQLMVFAATDDPELNHRISEAARSRGILINAADQPVDCDFIVPSIVKQGDLSIAVSTSGKSPALAKKIRRQLELQFGKEYEIFLQFMGQVRRAVFQLALPQQENSRIFQALIDSNIFADLAKGDRASVKAALDRILPAQLDRGCLSRFLTEGK